MTSYKTRLSIKTVGQIEFVVQNAQVFRAHEMVVKRVLVISIPRILFHIQSIWFLTVHSLSFHLLQTDLKLNIWSHKIV